MASGDKRKWVTVLRRKYLRGKSFFSCVGRAWNLRVWKGILNNKDLVRKESCFRVGNGWGIDVWRDSWVPWLTNKAPSSRNEEILTFGDKVAELFEHGNLQLEA